MQFRPVGEDQSGDHYVFLLAHSDWMSIVSTGLAFFCTCMAVSVQFFYLNSLHILKVFM